jgi:hypothetical protein
MKCRKLIHHVSDIAKAMTKAQQYINDLAAGADNVQVDFTEGRGSEDRGATLSMGTCSNILTGQEESRKS